MEGVTWVQFDSSSADTSQFVFVGKDSGENDLFVGRAPNGDDLIPGHFSLDNNHIWIASGDEETAIESFEALVNSGDYEWEASSDGQVPANAVACGKIDGETLYLGRCEHEEGIVMSGYIQPSKAMMFMPFDSSVFEKSSYEVLVKRS